MKLEDSDGDLKVLRGQLRTMSQQMESPFDARDRQVESELMADLEFFKNKVSFYTTNYKIA